MATVMLRVALQLFVILWLKKPGFESSNSVCYSFYGEEAVDFEQTYVYQSLWCYQRTHEMHICTTVDMRLLLFLSGDIELCPGPEELRDIPELEYIIKQRGLNFFHLNTHGLWNNMCHIMELLTTYRDIDIFSINETHMRDEPEELYHIDGYSFVSRPRSKGSGGGVAAYISDKVNWTRRSDLESELESLWLEIFPAKSKSFLMCVIYRPPNGSYLHANFESLFANTLALASSGSKEIIIMGDLNVDYFKRNDHLEIKRILTLNGFTQTIKEATRTTLNTATLIDIISTNNSSVIAATKVIPISFSDHKEKVEIL